MQFYFLLFCPVSSSCLGLPRLSALSPQFRESSRLHMDFFPATWPENGPSAVSWALIGLIFYFSSLIYDSSLWPDFYYLTKLFHSNCCPFFWLFQVESKFGFYYSILDKNTNIVSLDSGLYVSLYIYLISKASSNIEK